MTTLVEVYKKIENENKTNCDTFYSHSKGETFINERTLFIHTQKQKQLSTITLMIYLNQSILQLYQKSLGKGSSWTIDSVIEHNINISKYNHSAGSSYIKLPNKIRPPKKRID